MDIYYTIFSSSLHAAFMLSFNSESAWFAARSFGNTNMEYATLAAFAGAMIAMSINFGIGYYLSSVGTSKIQFREETYKTVSSFFSRYLVWVLFFPQIPFLGIIAAFAGLLSISPRKALCIIAAGRICYYGFYLFTPV